MAAVPDNQASTKAGAEALRRNDFEAAREHFRRATSTGRPTFDAWLGLAIACRNLQDSAGAIAAIDRALALEPYHFRALTLRGDLYAETGNSRAALSYYTTALRHAPPLNQLEPHVANELRRARETCDRLAQNFEAHLQQMLAEKGFDRDRSSQRFAQSVDLLTGKKKLYLQQPTQYYFPELPQIQFYDRALFSWLDAVEAGTDDIVAELQGVLKNDAEFQPYVERVVDRPRAAEDSLTNNRSWTAFYLWKAGEVVAENAARCPKTMRILEHIPHCRIPARTPSILFSQLRPGAHIRPHTGQINARLICHLPLIIPDKCRFRVGNDVRAWQKGKALVFDDTIEHEAWNDSDETRVVMIFEIWRPELSEEERTFVSAVIEASAAHSGDQAVWSA